MLPKKHLRTQLPFLLGKETRGAIMVFNRSKANALQPGLDGITAQ
jgi:hypothetical protein